LKNQRFSEILAFFALFQFAMLYWSPISNHCKMTVYSSRMDGKFLIWKNSSKFKNRKFPRTKNW